MLFASKIIGFLLAGIFSTSLYAKGVSDFDVKGIKLGDPYHQIKSKLPCQNAKTRNIGNKNWNYQVACGIGQTIGAEFILNLTHDEKVYSIFKEQTFSIEPDFENIRTQIISKYGTPDKEGILNSSYDNKSPGSYKTFCWGNCKIEHEDTSYWKGTDAKSNGHGQSLYIIYSTQQSSEGKYWMRFELEDFTLNENDEEWITKARKEEESNLDL